MSEEERHRSEEGSRVDMERLSGELKDLVLSLPPRELLGYIWSTTKVAGMLAEGDARAHHRAELNTVQFVLEYVHAVLASFRPGDEGAFKEETVAKIFKVAEELRTTTMLFCLFRAVGADGGMFGDRTGLILQSVLSNWVLVRGNRFGGLEGEFYGFVLGPHDQILRETYGIGAAEIAAGIQAAVNSLAGGHADAVDRMAALMEDAAKAEAEQGLTQKQVFEQWQRDQPEKLEAAKDVYMDLFRGGNCNLSRHTDLPAALLEDLAFERGAHRDLFAPGPLSGTPFRTLPARMKPLIKLDGEVFAADQAFVRDSAYRALLWNLLQRRPEYKKVFETRQKDMGETAFQSVLAKQLDGAAVHREVWYPYPDKGHWVENDLLVRIDDALLLVEAKAGAAATVASPATDFDRHGRSIHDLIVKAHDQCRRFLQYLASADEVPIYRREAGRYTEVERIRLADFRLVLPIGLTVESFSPYASLAKLFPDAGPILGHHPFLSLSIDDLFVLRRFLPTTGELLHYLEVRQAVAGIPQAILFDEMDHLGAYLTKNRFDWMLRAQLNENTELICWDGQSEPIDSYFADGEFADKAPPVQEYPEEAKRLLDALEATKEKGWLSVAGHIRNFGQESRNSFSDMLAQVRTSLSQHVSRYFQIGDDPPLFVWLQRTGYLPDMKMLQAKAQAGAIMAGQSRTFTVLAYVTPNGTYSRAVLVPVDIPEKGTREYGELQGDVVRMDARKYAILSEAIEMERELAAARMPGANDPCWCGSGKKYKNCHRA
ncbi:hypothetical protein XI08_10420 [Bradyrhizobium sp. CCBAU 11361]|nr:hypothetical protein [Bradyrhizobium sp. CCBAU 11361]